MFGRTEAPQKGPQRPKKCLDGNATFSGVQNLNLAALITYFLIRNLCDGIRVFPGEIWSFVFTVPGSVSQRDYSESYRQIMTIFSSTKMGQNSKGVSSNSTHFSCDIKLCSHAL